MSTRRGVTLRRVKGVALALGLACAAPGLVRAASPDLAVGRWRTQTHDGVIDLAACGDTLCGRLVTSVQLVANPDLRDIRDRDPALRARRLIGLNVFAGFRRGADAWVGGTIYNPDDGHRYQARITPLGPDRLRVRGCLFFPLCQSQVWVRLPR